jgi:hypothetical protein
MTMPTWVALVVEAGRAVEGNRHGGAVGALERQFAIGQALHAVVGEHALGVGAGAVVGEQVEQGHADQFALRLAGESHQGLVHHLDPAVPVAHHQDVGHGGQHREHELLGFLQGRVLLLQRHLVLEQVVVHLVHLLDDLDPGVLAQALQAFGEDGRAGVLGGHGAEDGRGWVVGMDKSNPIQVIAIPLAEPCDPCP